MWRLAFALCVGLVAASGIAIAAERCDWCGCKGGPGYRGPNHRCLSFRDLARVCGTPPTTHCSFEGNRAGRGTLASGLVPNAPPKTRQEEAAASE